MITHSRKIKRDSPKFLEIFLLFISLFLIGFLILSNLRIRGKIEKFHSQLSILKEKVKRLEKENKDLKEKISKVSENEYLEEVAREKFNLKKPGEDVIVVKKEKEKEVPSKIETKKTWLEKLKEKLENLF